MSDPHPLKVGDAISYVRNTNGATVTGVIAEVISRFELHPDEDWSYRLYSHTIHPWVGHAVTIGASRCTHICPAALNTAVLAP